MNEYVYYKKLYTIAFRLTGEEEAACKLTNRTLSLMICKDNNYLPENLKLTIIQMLKLYIEQEDLFYTALHNYSKEIIEAEDSILKLQRALLEINPISRVLIIWKDLLGFKIDEILHIIPFKKEELYAELNGSYRILKGYLNDSWNS
ncbi:MAG: hypothetical protein AB7V48_00600 [Sedimentibacter sp.]